MREYARTLPLGGLVMAWVTDDVVPESGETMQSHGWLLVASDVPAYRPGFEDGCVVMITMSNHEDRYAKFLTITGNTSKRMPITISDGIATSHGVSVTGQMILERMYARLPSLELDLQLSDVAGHKVEL